MSEEKDIIEVPHQEVIISAKNQIAKAQEVAEACKDIVRKKSVMIQSKRHIEVEGWQTIAIGHNCVLSARDVKKVDNGYSAVGEVRKITDGVVIATGEGFVGDDEANWEDKPIYARKAMAQTRGMSRAGRSAFAYVLVLMGDDFSTTPAEEMTGIKTEESKPACPLCGESAIIKSKFEDCAFVCYKKLKGCGTKFDKDMLPITNKPDKPTTTKEEGLSKLEGISDRVKGYFKAKNFNYKEQYTFCEECQWINDKMVGRIITEDAFGSDDAIPFEDLTIDVND